MFTNPNNIQICLFFGSLNNNKKFKSNVYKPKPHPHLLFVIVRTLNNTCNLMFTNPDHTHILFVLFILCSPNIKKVCNVTQTFFVCLFVCCSDYKELNLKPNPNNICDIFWMSQSEQISSLFFFHLGRICNITKCTTLYGTVSECTFSLTLTSYSQCDILYMTKYIIYACVKSLMFSFGWDA